MSNELIQCGFCHAKIDPETKETTPPINKKALAFMQENMGKSEQKIYELDKNNKKLIRENKKLKEEIESNAKTKVTKKPVERKPEQKPEPEQNPEQRKEGFLTWLHDE